MKKCLTHLANLSGTCRLLKELNNTSGFQNSRRRLQKDLVAVVVEEVFLVGVELAGEDGRVDAHFAEGIVFGGYG